MIEAVQRRFTKRVHGFAHRSNLDRLSALNADTLEYRRLIADLVMTYKILNHQVDICESLLFQSTISLYNTRGHNKRLLKQDCRINCRSNSFSCRIVNAWNSLSEDVVDATYVSTFKRLLKRCNFNHFLTVLK